MRSLATQTTQWRALGKPPVSTVSLVGFGREIVCPLICESMGTYVDGYGSFRSRAAAALDCG
jgi:hypothetical protein